MYMCGAPGQRFIAGRSTVKFTAGPKFATLPPHFDLASEATFLEAVGGYNNVLPGHDGHEPSFQRLAPMMLASVVYHQDWLQKRLHPEHPFFESRAWQAVQGHGRHLQMDGKWADDHCESTRMQPTGQKLIYLLTAEPCAERAAAIGRHEELRNAADARHAEQMSMMKEIRAAGATSNGESAVELRKLVDAKNQQIEALQKQVAQLQLSATTSTSRDDPPAAAGASLRPVPHCDDELGGAGCAAHRAFKLPLPTPLEKHARGSSRHVILLPACAAAP